MKHGNQKYDFSPLQNTGGSITVKPSNIYSLKSAMRQYFGSGTSIKDNFTFEEQIEGDITVTRK